MIPAATRVDIRRLLETTAYLQRTDIRNCVPGTPPVRILHLRVAEGSFDFRAGQYLEILHPRGEAIPLSIASTPLALPDIRLHFRPIPGAPGADLLEELLTADTAAALSLQIRGPAGTIEVTADESRRLLLIAGGTGIAQALSIAETLQNGSSTGHHLLACADYQEDFYCTDAFASLSKTDAHFVADPDRSADNLGLGWLRKHAGGLLPARIILCGSPGFVYAVTDTLQAMDIGPDRLESDVFAYAPR